MEENFVMFLKVTIEGEGEGFNRLMHLPSLLT